MLADGGSYVSGLTPSIIDDWKAIFHHAWLPDPSAPHDQSLMDWDFSAPEITLITSRLPKCSLSNGIPVSITPGDATGPTPAGGLLLRNHFTLFLFLVHLAATPACDDVAGGGDTVVDFHGDDVHSRTADLYSIDPAGLCLPTSPTGLIEDDMPGVQIFGTGHLGAGSIRVVITGDVTVEFVAGTWLEPRAMARLDPKMPQRMMIAGDVLLEGPGEFLVDANCMESQQSTPGKDSEFYSCTQEPTTPVQLCQRDCGDDQSCIWGCQQMQDDVATKYTDLRIVSLYIIDDCDDNNPLAFRFFDRTSGQAWPEEGIFKTVGVGMKTTTELTCTVGSKICLGGETNDTVIGVGLDGSGADGEDWCLQCGMSSLEGWVLGCG